MGAFNQLNGAIFDAAAIEARISAVDGRSIYNQRDGATLSMDSLARRLTALDGKVAVGQGGIEFDVDTFMRRLAAIEAGGFNPLSLFAAGEQGVWYDPSDFSTLFQDSAGTTPVTAVGQPVGKTLDKSGRGNHRIQATTTSRPTVQQDASGFFYLSYDGVDDGLATAGNVDFTGTSKLTVWVGVTKASDAAAGMLVELTATASSNPGGFYIDAPEAAGNFGFVICGTGPSPSGWSASPFPAPISKVLTLAADYSGASSSASVKPYVNGVLTQTASIGAAVAITGPFANAPLYFGRRGGSSLPFNGREYQLIVRGAATADLTAGNTFVGSKMGIAL